MSGEPGGVHGEIAELPREDAAARDGIAEDDHPIPRWFHWSFLASIAFACVYIPYYLFSGWSQVAQYADEAARLEQGFVAVREELPTANPFRGDAEAIAAGEQIFASICAACHLPDGRGLVGPSLIDAYWKYGESDEALYESVAKGRPGGMPPWGAQLGSDEIWQVLAHMEALPRSDAPGIGAPDYQPPGG